MSSQNREPHTPLDDSMPGSVLGNAWAEQARHRRSRFPILMGALLVVAGLASFGMRQWLRDDVSAQVGSRSFIVTTPSETVNANVAFDITVEVQSANATDTSYTGTVKFSSPEDPAFAVADYTFTTADAGKHTFALAGQFATAGIKTIEVVDTVDANARGSASVEVLGNGGGNGTGIAPVISSPVDGTTVNQAIVNIRGSAAPNANVSISDNDAPLGTAIALADGSFTFDTPALAEGPHRFVATADGLASTPVNVTVQTGGASQTPELILSRETVSVAPGQPAPPIDAQVFAEQGLRSVKLSLDQRLIDLSEDLSTPGVYKGSFLSPTTAGSYPVDVIVENVLGAAQPFSSLKTLVVTADTTPLPTTNTPPTASFAFTPVSGDVPLSVTFTATASDAEDGTNVSYAWDFGDGGTSIEQNPVHVYTTAGPYAPQLTVRDSGGLEATVIANPEITATGPAMVAALLVLSAALATFVVRLRAA